MLNIHSYISVVPRIVHAHAEQKITILPRYGFITLQGMYEVSVLPKYSYPSAGRITTYASFQVEARENRIEFVHAFGREQEYVIHIVPSEETGAKAQQVLTSVYALEPDLYGLKVGKGDLHLHTTCSDGLESPDHRLAMARRLGMDFLAITDHNGYAGSERTRLVLERCPGNMVALRGEEVHADGCPVHILSLGAEHAIAPLVTARSEEQKRCLWERAESSRDFLEEDVDAFAYAAAMDVFDKIRQAGGLSVLCHIYWDAVVPGAKQRLGVPEQLIDALVGHCAFDAFEITSGAPLPDLKANYLQEAYYRERLPAGFPIIGITDSHSTDPSLGSIFGGNYTIAFMEAFNEAGLISAIQGYRTIAIDGVSGHPVCHGALRLCKYATFLLAEYFPVHDELVMLEGVCMDRFLRGDGDALTHLDAICRKNVEMLRAEWDVIVPDVKG